MPDDPSVKHVRPTRGACRTAARQPARPASTPRPSRHDQRKPKRRTAAAQPTPTRKRKKLPTQGRWPPPRPKPTSPSDQTRRPNYKRRPEGGRAKQLEANESTAPRTILISTHPDLKNDGSRLSINTARIFSIRSSLLHIPLLPIQLSIHNSQAIQGNRYTETKQATDQTPQRTRRHATNAQQSKNPNSGEPMRFTTYSTSRHR